MLLSTRWPLSRVTLCVILPLLFLLITLTSARAQPAQYSEAPSLAERVAAGELPPVAERLPANPLVVEPVERVGEYGGTWRTMLTGPADTPWLGRTIGYEYLVRWDPSWSTIIPNIAESFEVSDDATEYTFRLREGMRWSDGEPVTADDFVFWYEDVFMNSEITPVQSGWLVVEDEPVVLEKLDDTTIVFRFAAPNGVFLSRLASGSGGAVNPVPRHYMEQFHLGYNPDGIDALVSEAGADDWVALFGSQNDSMQNPERPSLNAWVPTIGLGDATNRFTTERNPFYFKVDTAGNQLPYLDRVNFDMIADAEVMLLRALSGEIDMHVRHINDNANRAVLFDGQAQGDYRLFETTPSRDNVMVVSFNLTHEDPVKREIFNNKDFRIGLSHAIDRPEIIDLVYIGQGEPSQVAPLPDAPFYDEQLSQQYTDYDPALANEYLDQAGYSERDANGFRLGPDGRRIVVTVELFDRSEWVDMMELIQGYWRVVGIDAQIRVADRSLFQTRAQANQHDAAAWFGGGGLMDALIDIRSFLPDNWESLFGVAWASWYNNPEGLGSPATQPEEPPAEVMRQLQLYDQLKATAGEDEQIELMQQILEITQEQFYTIGIAHEPPGYGIVKNTFHNVPEAMFASSQAYNEPAPTNPEQYFISSDGAASR